MRHCFILIVAALGFATGCNDVLGFVPGMPYPPDASVDGASADGALADRSSPDGGNGGGRNEGGACGQTQCGASCTDTSNDPKNCGACNHDCTALMHIGEAD